MVRRPGRTSLRIADVNGCAFSRAATDQASTAHRAAVGTRPVGVSGPSRRPGGGGSSVITPKHAPPPTARTCSLGPGERQARSHWSLYQTAGSRRPTTQSRPSGPSRRAVGSCPRPKIHRQRTPRRPSGGVSIGGWAAARALPSPGHWRRSPSGSVRGDRVIPQEPPSSLRMTTSQAAVGIRKHVWGWANQLPLPRGAPHRGAGTRTATTGMPLSCAVNRRRVWYRLKLSLQR